MAMASTAAANADEATVGVDLVVANGAVAALVTAKAVVNPVATAIVVDGEEVVAAAELEVATKAVGYASLEGAHSL